MISYVVLPSFSLVGISPEAHPTRPAASALAYCSPSVSDGALQNGHAAAGRGARVAIADEAQTTAPSSTVLMIGMPRPPLTANNGPVLDMIQQEDRAVIQL